MTKFFAHDPGQMGEQEFVAVFGGVYESSPWIVEQYWHQTTGRPSASVATVAAALADIVDMADIDRRLKLIRAHPDLAGRAALAGQVTAQSQDEQASAGLDRCTAAELAHFHQLNDGYRAKFGFPFIMAVKGANRQKILAGFTARLDNDIETELARAISEIHKIARLRLEDIAQHG